MKKYCLNHTQELREHTEKEIRSLGWDNFEGVVYPETLNDQNKSELILEVLDKWLKESHDDMVMITFDDLFYGFYQTLWFQSGSYRK